MINPFLEKTLSSPRFLQLGENEPLVALTSRLRLARNLEEFPFPGWAKREQREKIFLYMKPVIETFFQKNGGNFYAIEELNSLERKVLIERHLMSRQHSSCLYGGVGLSINQDLSVLVNEEDHLRIQAIGSGFCLQDMYRLADEQDSFFAQSFSLPFVFDEKVGFITSCPSNFGTAMRASVMLHLPGLVLSNQGGKIINAAMALGYTIRGFYGEETKPLGNLFQVSNQITLGKSEQSIIQDLEKFVAELIVQEKNARLKIFQENTISLKDQILRAYGLIQYAQLMNLGEALRVLSLILLGYELGIFQEDVRSVYQNLLQELQSGHLQWRAGTKKLEGEAYDSLRAEKIRKKLDFLNSPKF